MNENQLQAALVMWFSQKYPHFRGLLFEVNNDTYNAKHGMKRKAMGMIAGVSDLIFIAPQGRILGIELKAPKTTHKTAHIKQQLEWGKIIQDTGNLYVISSNLEILKSIIDRMINFNIKSADLACQNELDKIDLGKSTVKF